MMNSKDLIYLYEPLWGSWKIDSLIGTGSTGTVYKVVKKDYNCEYVSAVKFILVPTYEQYKSVLSYFNSGDKNSIHEYFENIVQSILNEIELLYDLKEHGNIINYEDHLIKKIDGKDEWHILIRMEYANSLDIHILNNSISEKEIVKIGIDICSALEFCHNKNILHRDIKEANIFVSKNKIYKLGDFSISKEVSELTMAHTKVGTFNYMAPEVFNNKAYTKNADIYSLGIVLYKLANHGRMPFLPDYPDKILPKDIEKSNMSRLSGEEIIKPLKISDGFFSILKKACAYDQKDRYKLASEMKNALEKIYSECSDKSIYSFESNISNTNESKNLTSTYIALNEMNSTFTYNNILRKTDTNTNTNDSVEFSAKSVEKPGVSDSPTSLDASDIDHTNITNKNITDPNSNVESHEIEKNTITNSKDSLENEVKNSNPKNNRIVPVIKLNNIYNYVFKSAIIIISIVLIIFLIKSIASNSNQNNLNSISSTTQNSQKPESTIKPKSGFREQNNHNTDDNSNIDNKNFLNKNDNQSNETYTPIQKNTSDSPLETDLYTKTTTPIHTKIPTPTPTITVKPTESPLSPTSSIINTPTATLTP